MKKERGRVVVTATHRQEIALDHLVEAVVAALDQTNAARSSDRTVDTSPVLTITDTSEIGTGAPAELPAVTNIIGETAA